MAMAGSLLKPHSDAEAGLKGMGSPFLEMRESSCDGFI